MIRLQNATPGHVPRYADRPVGRTFQLSDGSLANVTLVREEGRGRPGWRMLLRLPRWMYRGYTEVNASDMAAAVAFNTLVALLPMFLLMVSIAGLFLKNDQVLRQAIIVIDTMIPGGAADEAFNTALTARNNSGWLGVISILGFAWVGTGFVSCLARSMNRIYGARTSGYINEKQRGFLVLSIFSLLFAVSLAATILTSFFVRQELPDAIEPWLLATFEYQMVGYLIGFASALGLFFTLYRVIPNAGQRMPDVWPGALTASLLLMLVTQIFPVYIRITGGGNRYGQILGFVSLLVASLFFTAHIILFGAYINATWQRRRRQQQRRKRHARALAMGVSPSAIDDMDVRLPD